MTNENLFWDSVLFEIKKTKDFKNILGFIKKEKKRGVQIYPELKNIFNAFSLTNFKDIKVVILGQDPYHEIGQANGLAFSVPKGIKIPPSLRNIFMELNNDIGCNLSSNGDLSSWAKQGVFLLNSFLSVEKGSPMSHSNIGWDIFTDQIIRLISQKHHNVVFILWGAFAKKKIDLIDDKKHKIIISSHPSPFSARRGFFGSRPFSKTNLYLKKTNQKIIDWSL